MPDYVYALHDFIPEHDDEIAFRAGDRIEVIERDDMYGDGWWQGRNLFGKVGLFPQGYTTSDPAVLQPPPSSAPQPNGQESSVSASQAQLRTPLQTLNEESDVASGASSIKNGQNGEAHAQSPQIMIEREESGATADSEGVMKATMTDVQEAIEQLGRKRDLDGGGSFSFASSREGDTTDRESEAEGEGEGEGENWHRGTRAGLAEKARAEQQRLSDADPRTPTVPRETQPPIDVELSDESEAEADDDDADHAHAHTRGHGHGHGHGAADTHFARRAHAHISEEEESDADAARLTNGFAHAEHDSYEGVVSPQPTRAQAPEAFELRAPSQDDDDGGAQTATARQSAFPAEVLSIPAAAETEFASAVEPHTDSAEGAVQVQPNGTGLQPAALLTPTSPNSLGTQQARALAMARPMSTPELKGASAQQQAMLLPSPPTSMNGAASRTAAAPSVSAETSKTHPSEWTVEEVVEWAKSKNFDAGICNKFIEHEISGDVLLDLDVNLLKTELEIPAFGKRMRIANAIAELRRPPSIISSSASGTHTQQTGMGTGTSTTPHTPRTPLTSQAPTHEHSLSQSISLPGSSHASMIMGLGSPYGVLSPESPPHTGDIAATPAMMSTFRRDSDPGSSLRNASTTDHGENTVTSTANTSATGLGLGWAHSVIASSAIGSSEKLEPTKSPKNRPAHLTLSPSDNSLGSKAKSASFAPDLEAEGPQERGALSDTESTNALDSRSKRRRIFGRSAGSTMSDGKDNESRHSKEGVNGNGTTVTSVPGSPSAKRRSAEDGTTASLRGHTRAKRSVDAGKSSDRLSLFGNFPSLGRNRKPPPRVASYAQDDLSTGKSSGNLARLYHLGTNGRKASARSSIGDDATLNGEKENGKSLDKGKGKEKERDTNGRDPQLLRKRTASHADTPPPSLGALKPGQSVLEQIGEPDHNGWMRKKGEHYNTWKLRYFVLKAHHLYILRDNSKAVTTIKGYINILGYKVIVDENVNPGKYGFRLIHDTDKTHYFSSDEQIVVREWMKALMKATIGRDYTKPVISSCNIPTIPLSVAQTMNPAPRPPSPTQRDATQKALRRENPNQLSSRDARILMGLPSGQNGSDLSPAPEKPTDDAFFKLDTLPNARIEEERSMSPQPTTSAPVPKPPRPSRETRRTSVPAVESMSANADLFQWANGYLPEKLQFNEGSGQMYGGLALYRLAEAIKGKPTEPPVPDSAFPSGPNDDRLDGLFKLFDFMLDNDMKLGTVTMNDVRQGKRDKIVYLLRTLKAWEEKRKSMARSMGRSGAHAGPFMALDSGSQW